LLEEVAAAMAPARRLSDRAGFAFAIVEFAKPGISIGLQNPGIAGEMSGGMLAATVARIKEHGSWRVGPGKWPIVAHISP